MVELVDKKDVILDALQDYRKWFDMGDSESDQAKVREIDEAIVAINESMVSGADTVEVVVGGKRFYFETVRDDVGGIRCVHLTECGDPGAIEMLEAYDLYPKE